MCGAMASRGGLASSDPLRARSGSGHAPRRWKGCCRSLAKPSGSHRGHLLARRSRAASVPTRPSVARAQSKSRREDKGETATGGRSANSGQSGGTWWERGDAPRRRECCWRPRAHPWSSPRGYDLLASAAAVPTRPSVARAQSKSRREDRGARIGKATWGGSARARGMGACVHHTYRCTGASPWSASSSSSSTGASALSNLGFLLGFQTWGILAFCRPSTGQTSDQEAWGRSNGWARGHVRRHSARGHTTHAAGDGDATIGRSRARGART